MLKATCLGGKGRSAHSLLTDQKSSVCGGGCNDSNNFILEPVANVILRILPKHLHSAVKAESWKTLHPIPTRKVSYGRKIDTDEY